MRLMGKYIDYIALLQPLVVKKENVKIIWGCNPGGGVLTLTWYTYMCLPFGAPFREIWYSDRGVFIRDEGAQIT